MACAIIEGRKGRTMDTIAQTLDDIAAEDPANIPRSLAFADPDPARLHRKQRVAAGYRMLARFGLDEGIAGHITVRDPERPDHFLPHRSGATSARSAPRI